MNYQNKTKEELLKELQEIQQEYSSLKAAFEKDFTKYKKAEEKIKLSEGRLAAAQKVARIGSWETDLADLCVIWSDETFRIFEIDKNGFKSSHPDFLKFVHPEDRAKVDSAFLESFNHHEYNSIEHRIITPEGKGKYVEERWQIYYNDKAIPIKAQGTCQDITERKQAEEEIIRMAQVLNVTPNSITIHDLNGNFMYANQKTFDLHGYTKEEFLALPLGKLDTPDTAKMIPARMKEIIEKGKATFKVEHFKKDGSIMPLEVFVCITKWGDVNALLSISTDITERKQAEESLQESEEKYRQVFQTSSDAISINQRDGVYIDVNEGFTNLIGYSVKDVTGKFSNEINIWAIPEDLEKMVTGLKEKGFVKNLESKFRCKDGSIITAIMSANIIMLNNEPHILTITRDITERKRAEDEIREAHQKLSKMNAEKDKFFSIIAHDLKSPFNSIVGFSNLLVEQVREKDYNGIEKYAEIIDLSSNRALDLLMNLMEWSQSQTGRMEFNPEYFELVELIKDTELLLSGAMEQKSISLSKSLPSNAPVFADKKMISTVLRNLISNAIKFTHSGGKITISVEEKQDELLVWVSDTGVGISKANVEKLFKIDETYSRPGTNKEKGTGLGLILCKEFVEKNGGKIWVESEVGKGSTFYFTIPFGIKLN